MMLRLLYKGKDDNMLNVRTPYLIELFVWVVAAWAGVKRCAVAGRGQV